MNNIISFVGLFVLILVAWLFSNNKRVINRRVIFWGLTLQFIFGFFIFILPWGQWVFGKLNNIVLNLLSYSAAGTRFVFGNLSLPPGTQGSTGFYFAFQVLPAIIFFATLVGLLYYFSIMQIFIRFFSKLFTTLMRISGAESFCVSSNIFVGVESGLTIRPYLAKMTRSELFAILVGGMSTIASTVLGVYTISLRSTFPSIAGHLISASLLTAPAALLMAKVIYPETETPETMGQSVGGDFERPSNWVEAILRSANEGIKLAVGIGTTLIAFIGLVALANGVLGWLGSSIGQQHTTLEGLLSYIFYPLVVVIGVPLHDAWNVATLLGTRVIATELTSYQMLATMIKDGIIQNPRTVVITTYALCGFAHIPSVAIFVGGLSAIEPKRTKDLSSLGFKALVGATLACLMTGAIAGVFYTKNNKLLLTHSKKLNANTKSQQDLSKTPKKSQQNLSKTPKKRVIPTSRKILSKKPHTNVERSLQKKVIPTLRKILKKRIVRKP